MKNHEHNFEYYYVHSPPLTSRDMPVLSFLNKIEIMIIFSQVLYIVIIFLLFICPLNEKL